MAGFQVTTHGRFWVTAEVAAEITVDDCREYRAHRRKLGIA